MGFHLGFAPFICWPMIGSAEPALLLSDGRRIGSPRNNAALFMATGHCRLFSGGPSEAKNYPSSRRNFTQDQPAVFGVPLHQRVFFVVEFRGFAQDGVGYPDFADVVQQRGYFQILEHRLVETELLADAETPLSQARAVDANVQILQVQELVEGADRGAAKGVRTLLELFDPQRCGPWER